ncbi:hypothetical protein [Halomonas sp. WWR20]
MEGDKLEAEVCGAQPEWFRKGDSQGASFRHQSETPLVVSFGTLLLWFALLRRYWIHSSDIAGIRCDFGAVLLNEPLMANFMVGGVVILAGIVLVSH